MKETLSGLSTSPTSRFRFQSESNGMIFRVGVSGPRSDNVANPAECAASANPEPGCDDQPENARKDAAVVELAYSGNNETQEACQNRIAHLLVYLRPSSHTTKDVSLFFPW